MVSSCVVLTCAVTTGCYRKHALLRGQQSMLLCFHCGNQELTASNLSLGLQDEEEDEAKPKRRRRRAQKSMA